MASIKIDQSRFFSGLLIILIGLLFLLGALGKVDVGYVFSTYWPLILVFIGLWHLIAHSFRDTGFGVILIVIGGFFMLVNWDIIGGSVWHYFWPLLIIAAGLWIIFKPGFRRYKGEIPPVTEKDLDVFSMFSGFKSSKAGIFRENSGPTKRLPCCSTRQRSDHWV